MTYYQYSQLYIFFITQQRKHFTIERAEAIHYLYSQMERLAYE